MPDDSEINSLPLKQRSRTNFGALALFSTLALPGAAMVDALFRGQDDMWQRINNHSFDIASIYSPACIVLAIIGLVMPGNSRVMAVISVFLMALFLAA